MEVINKKSLSERDICTKFITPAIKDAGWDIQSQVREEVTFTAGRIIVRGELVARSKKKRADYILFYKPNIPIAVIEAKDNNHSISAGMQQALDYSESLDVPFVFSSNGDGFQSNGKKWCNSPTKIAFNNDVLISVRAPVGPTNLCQQKSCIGRGLAAIRSFSDANHYYLMYYLRAIEDTIASQGVGSTFKAISRKQLEGLNIPIPPANEQKRIVAKVDQLMALCDELEQQQQKKASIRVNLNKASLHSLTTASDQSAFKHAWQRIADHFDILYDTPETVQELRQAILQLAVQGRLVPQNPDDESANTIIKDIESQPEYEKSTKKFTFSNGDLPHEVPSNWCWTNLGIITEIKGGKRVANGYKLLTKPTPYIYIRVRDMKDGTIDDSDLHYIDAQMYSKIKKYIIRKEDVYMTIVGATIGKCGLVPAKFDGMNLTENAARLVLKNNIDRKYLLYCLQSSVCQNQFFDNTKQVGVQKLALKRLASTNIPLPPFNEQSRIVEKVDQLMALCDDLEAKLTQSRSHSEKLMDAIVHSLVNGNPAPSKMAPEFRKSQLSLGF